MGNRGHPSGEHIRFYLHRGLGSVQELAKPLVVAVIAVAAARYYVADPFEYGPWVVGLAGSLALATFIRIVLGIVNNAVFLTETELVVQDWIRRRRSIGYGAIRRVVWLGRPRHGNAELHVEQVDDKGRARTIRVADSPSADVTARLRDALVAGLGFVTVEDVGTGLLWGREKLAYEAPTGRAETTLDEASLDWVVDLGKPVRSVYWLCRNPVHYLLFIGVPGLFVVLFTLGTAGVTYGSWVNAATDVVLLSAGWAWVIWQVLRSLNEVALINDIELVRRDWRKRDRLIPWQSIEAVIWRSQGWLGSELMRKVLELEVTNPYGETETVHIAGGWATQVSARRLRDAIIVQRGFPAQPRSTGEARERRSDIIWREAAL